MEQEIGQFENHDDGTNDFIIKEVTVYQNREYEPFIKSPSDYQDRETLYMGLIIGSGVAGGAIVIAAAVLVIRLIVKRVKAKKQQNG